MLSLQLCAILLFNPVNAARGHNAQKSMLARVWESLPKPAGNASFPAVQKRQDSQSTCGFESGDASRPRTANPGFDCRFDTAHGLWGFCPTTVISATDCGLAGNCVDSQACVDGCGLTGIAGITTFSCGTNGFCSTVLLTEGPDQVFSYIACGPTATVQHYLATPTAATTSSKQAIPSSSTSIAATTPIPSPTPTPTTALSSSSSSSLSISSAATTSSSFPSSSSSSQTSVIIQQSSTSSGGQTLSSTTNPSAATSSSTAAAAASATHLGPIIGGAIGGLVILCLFVLGILYLRRDARKKQAAGSPTLPGWWKAPYRTTKMQTSGLHELDDNRNMVHEADAGSRFSRDAYGGSKQGRYQMYELGS